MAALFWNFIGLLLLPLAFSFAFETYHALAARLGSMLSNWFIYGAAAFLALYFIVPRNRIAFLEILEHELCHAAVALLFLKDLQTLKVAVNGVWEGSVEYLGYSNFLIRLAPYYIPLFALPFLIVKPFVFSSAQPVFDLLIGFTLAFYYARLATEFRPRQKDIQRAGHIYALAVIVVLNCIFLAAILAVVLNDYPHILDYFQISLARTRDSYQLVIQAIQNRL